MTTESKALAPCPFCGRRAGNRGRDDYGLFAVFCYGCGAEIADDTIEKARVMWNTRAQPVVGWRPIESAPRDGTEILVCRAINADGQPIAAENFGIFCHVAAWWEGDAAWIVYCSMTKDPETHFTPTHWMPLPAPPGEQAQPVVDEAMVEAALRCLPEGTRRKDVRAALTAAQEKEG